MQTWTIDPSHSSVRFSVRHLMFAKVHGVFRKFAGELSFDEKSGDFVSARAVIHADSIDTAEEKRDAHLRSADFFEVESYPTLSFESTHLAKTQAGYELQGNLTIKGNTRPVVLKVDSLGRAKDPWGGTRAGFTGSVTIERKDFGLTWNMLLEAGGIAVGEKVEIALEIQAVAPKAAVDASAAATA